MVADGAVAEGAVDDGVVAKGDGAAAGAIAGGGPAAASPAPGAASASGAGSGHALGVLAGVQLAVYSLLWTAGDLRAHPHLFLGAIAVASVAFAASVAVARRGGSATRLGPVLLWAALLRVPLALAGPSLSDDVWRYLWDGRVAAAGIDPYLHAPADPALDAVEAPDGPLRSRVNHPEVPTIYPPLAQRGFRLAHVGGGLAAWKAIVLGCDALALAAVLWGLGRQGRPLAGALLYAWNPLVIVEVAGSAHVDAGAAASVALAVALAAGGRPRLALVAATLGAAIKVYPVLLVPWLLGRVEGGWRARARALAAPVLIGLALVAPHVGAGLAASSEGLRTYGAHWHFNSPVFEGLRAALGSGGAARLAMAGALVGIAALSAVCGTRDPAWGLALMGAMVVLSPTIYPWYVLAVAPLLPLAGRGPWRAFALLTQTVLLSYAVLGAFARTGRWEVPTWAAWAQWLPFAAVLAAEAAAGLRRAGARSARGDRPPPAPAASG